MRPLAFAAALLASAAAAQVVPAGSSGLSVTVNRDQFALGPPGSYSSDPEAVVRGGGGVRIVAQASEVVLFSACSAVLEKRGATGAWVLADTLSCPGVSGPDDPEGHVRSASHPIILTSGFLREVVGEHGAGTYRAVYYVTDGGGALFDREARTSPPFALVDFASVHPDAVEAFRARPGWKALAVGQREDHSYFWGHSYGFASAAAAVNRALDECRERATRDGDSPCWAERVEGPPGSED